MEDLAARTRRETGARLLRCSHIGGVVKIVVGSDIRRVNVSVVVVMACCLGD